MRSQVIYHETSVTIVNTQPDIIRQPITSQPSANSVCSSNPWVYSVCGSLPLETYKFQETGDVHSEIKPHPLSKSENFVSFPVYTGSRDWSKDLFDSFKEVRKSKRKCRAFINLCSECCRVPCMMSSIASSLGDSRYLPFIPGTGAAIRFKVRILCGIQGTIGNDCVVTSFCCPCATCQMYREMEELGLGAAW